MIHYHRHTLPNGLTVLLHRDVNTPLVALNMLFRAGSKYDPPKATGLAHLFEHLMFSGTETVPNFDVPMQMAGGENNAFTNSDYASYYCYGPADNLETFLFLESDRLQNLRLKENEFRVQQKVVIEELYESCFAVPYGDVWHHLLPMIYQELPYSWPTIGRSVEELLNMTLEDAHDFHRRYYHISNAILSITGNINIEETTGMIEKYFGSLNGPAQDRPQFDFSAVPNRRLREIVSGKVPVKSFYFVFPMEGRNSKNYYALDLISDLMAVGKSSLLYQHFIKKYQMLTSVDAYITGNVDAGLFIVEGKIAGHFGFDAVENEFWKLVNKLKETGIDQQLMQKLKNTSESNIIFSEIGTLNKAMNLCYFELLGDIELINREANIYRDMDADYLDSVFKDFIDPLRMNVLKYSPR